MKLKYQLSVWAAAAISALSLTSCSDDFLDRQPDGYYITDDQMTEAMKWNTDVLLGELQGTSRTLFRWKSGGTSLQDDFGQKSVDITTDLLCRDMVFSLGDNYGWFGDAAQMTSTNYDGARTSILWKYYYNVIYSANQILDTAGGDEVENAPENETNRLYFAVAKTIRAYAYYNLVLNYCDNYDVAKEQKVLPVYRTQTDSYSAPQTVDSVYSLILKDLDDAITIYADAAKPSDISIPAVDVAYTLKAYAQLSMGNYAAAAQTAAQAISNSGCSMLAGDDLFFGFNTIKNSDWMWGIDITDDNTGGLCTFWGMMDYFTYSYASVGDFKVMNSDLFAQIPTTDYRRMWFTAFGSNVRYLLPANKWFDDAREAMGDATWTNDIHFMRIEEAYMIAAEAAARQGDLATARQYLGAMLEGRDTDKAEAIQTMTQDELLDEIYFNWRVEFWGEGKALQTMKRFKKDITCPANDYYGALTQDGAIPYNSTKLRFRIPQNERQNNPLMSTADGQ